jgi:hypothetical protein
MKTVLLVFACLLAPSGALAADDRGNTATQGQKRGVAPPCT